jgi:hypothetical protein
MASRNRDTSKLLNLVDLAPGVKHRVVLNARNVLKSIRIVSGAEMKKKERVLGNKKPQQEVNPVDPIPKEERYGSCQKSRQTIPESC